MAKATVKRQGADSSNNLLAPSTTLLGNGAELETRRDSPTAVSRLAAQLPRLLEALQEGLQSARECAVSIVPFFWYILLWDVLA
ncbi:hypothetical protein, partial [Staphylococcus aureus]|uniref:hypothetical protein n=1 Tax=Staphylococcus aureus TaxID=1280 RepID=UPI00210B4DCC